MGDIMTFNKEAEVSCWRCGGSGRNYVDGWACGKDYRPGTSGHSRMTPCPVCVIIYYPQYNPTCLKELEQFKIFQNLTDFRGRPDVPECHCERCGPKVRK